MAQFLLKKISANRGNTAYVTGALDEEPVIGEPDVMWQSEAYIADTGQIWTNGALFGGNAGGGSAASADLETERQERILADRRLQEAIDDLSTSMPTLIHFDLNPATGHLTLTKADPGDRFSAEVADGRLLLTITE